LPQLTTEEYIKKNRVKLEALVRFDIPLKIAVYTIVGEQSIRIFQMGLNSAGSKIGVYDSGTGKGHELWIPDSRSPINGNHKGKPAIGRGETGKKSSKVRVFQFTVKNTYYKNYQDYRKRMKRESGFVNLRLNNELQSDFSNAKISKTSTKVIQGQPIRVNANYYKTELKKDINQKKREGLEDKYGKIFSLTKEEKTKYFAILQKELKIALL